MVLEQSPQEETCQEEKHPFTWLLDHMTDAFLSVNAHWECVMVNHQAEEMLNQPRHELVGKLFWEIFLPECGSEFVQQAESDPTELNAPRNRGADFETTHVEGIETSLSKPQTRVGVGPQIIDGQTPRGVVGPVPETSTAGSDGHRGRAFFRTNIPHCFHSQSSRKSRRKTSSLLSRRTPSTAS